MNSTSLVRRRGISLLEVLISIGILSIGLLSVLALLPAGRTYLVKAEVDDRAATIIPNALSTMEALGLFGKDSLEWNSRTSTAVDDGERPAERPMFLPQEYYVKLRKGETTLQKINEQRWDTTNVETATITNRYLGDLDDSVVLSGKTPEPKANVRISSTGTGYEINELFTSGSTGAWDRKINLSSLMPSPMQVHATGPSVGMVITDPPHWIDVTFDVKYEQTNPDTGEKNWVDVPFTITPDPSRSDPTNIPAPGYRHYGQRRRSDRRTGKASIQLGVAPVDQFNNTPDQAQAIAPPKLLDIVENGKIRMIRRAYFPYEGEVWRFQTGTWKADYQAEFSFANTEAQTVTSKSYTYPSWGDPEKDPPGSRLRTTPDSSPQDVDYVTFPVSAGDGFQLDWTRRLPPTTRLSDLADPSDGVGDPFAVEFQRNGGTWLPLDPFDSIGHNYSVPNDGKVRLGVGLRSTPSGGPANTPGYDTSNPALAVPLNTQYKLDISVFRPDRMVAIDPLMCAHLDRVIHESSFQDAPLQHPLASRRLRFADFEQWFMGSRANARAFVIPRLNWRKIANLGFEPAIAVAERICRAEDSVVANTPVDGDAANEPGFDVSKNGEPLRRQAAGRMTWMLTVQPEDPGSVEANWQVGRYFNASVVVFQDRRFPEVGATALEGEYAFEAGWHDNDGLIRIYVPNATALPTESGKTALDDDDLKRLLGAGSWMLLGPRVTYTSTPVDSQMRLEWVKIQSSQIERQKDQIVVTVLPEREPGKDVLLKDTDAANPSRYVLDNGVQRLRIMVLAYQGVVAVVQRSIQVRP